MANTKKNTAYLIRDGRSLEVFTEEEFETAIDEGSLNDGDEVWEVELGKPGKLSLGEWSIDK